MAAQAAIKRAFDRLGFLNRGTVLAPGPTPVPLTLMGIDHLNR